MKSLSFMMTRTFLLLLVVGCTSQHHAPLNEKTWEPSYSDAVSRERLSRKCTTPQLPQLSEVSNNLERDPISPVIEVERALQLGDLSAIPSGWEIRIWIGYGLCWPQELLCIRGGDGDPQGEIYLWWETDIENNDDSKTWTMYQFVAERDCKELVVTDDVAVCRLCSHPSYPWAQIAEALEALGIWTLPDQSEILNRDQGSTDSQAIRCVFDGTTFLVETARPNEYRVYSHTNPDSLYDNESHLAELILKFVYNLSP